MRLEKSQIQSMLADGFRIGENYKEKADWVFDMALMLMGDDMGPDTYTQFLDSIATLWKQDEMAVKSTDIVETLLERGADPLYNTQALKSADTSHLDNSLNIPWTPNTPSVRAGPFARALATGNDELLRLFFKAIQNNPAENAPDVNAFVTTTGKPLICAAVNAVNIHDQHFISDGALEGMLRCGWDANTRDAYGNTVLHFAHSKNKVNILLAHGAKADVKSADGEYPWDTWATDPCISHSVLRGMETQVRKHLKAAKGTDGASILADAHSGAFRAAYAGNKTGIPKDKDKLASMTKKVHGFNDEVNLLEMALIGFLDNPKQPANAFNYISEIDEDGALWTDKACLLGIAAMMSDAVTMARTTRRGKVAIRGMNEACSRILKQCLSKNLIDIYHNTEDHINTPVAINPKVSRNALHIYGGPNVFTVETKKEYRLCFDKATWEIFGEVMCGVIRHLASDFDLMTWKASRKEPSSATIRLPSRLALGIPQDGYPTLYSVMDKIGRFSRNNRMRVFNDLFPHSKKDFFGNGKEAARLSADPSRSEKFAYALLGTCCAKQPMNRRRGTIDWGEVKTILGVALETMSLQKDRKAGLAAMKSFSKEVDKVESWLNGIGKDIDLSETASWEAQCFEMSRQTYQTIKSAAGPALEKAIRNERIDSLGSARQRMRKTNRNAL